MIHSFLLIGQSNMGGRGYINEVAPIHNEHLLVLRNGRWRQMYQPVNPDRVTSGVNLSESFALSYHKDKGVDVGLIPCADGGTNIDQWCVGGLLYDHAVYMARLAMRTSTIAGVLWHQGESDSTPERFDAYEGKLKVIMESFRKDLGLYDAPFLLGGLGDYLKDYNEPISTHYTKINASLIHYAKNSPMTGFVSAEGLLANPDNLHFSATALRDFGLRYYEEFKKLEDKNKVFTEKATPDSAIRTELEVL